MTKPMVSLLIQEFGHDPFLILISCLLSLRTRDTTTLPVCRQLFAVARTPQAILALPEATLQKMLYSVGFYRRKTIVLRAVSHDLIEKFQGSVPKSREELLTLPGVGRKTANLVLGQGFGIPAICVDTHVHRISNSLGLVRTKTPVQTEQELEKIIPKEYWIEWNNLLVMWGQNIRRSNQKPLKN